MKGDNKLTFLPHVEGLRGVAILLVLLFHINSTLCVNGYLGVDVFFVISGYFLFRGFLKGDASSFCVRSFMMKKWNRIMPSVFAVILVSLSVACFFLPPNHNIKSAYTAISALFSCSNIYLDQIASGYFSEESSCNVLLHTWYLGVTMQAYLIFAVLWRLLRKCSFSVKRLALIVVGIASFCWLFHFLFLRIICPEAPMRAVYYLTTCRLYEFVVGGMVLFLPKVQHKPWLETLPFVAILTIIVAAFIPIKISLLQIVVLVSSAFLMWCPLSKTHTVTAIGKCAAWMLENPITRRIGKYSFSIYVWHWPFVAVWVYYHDYSFLSLVVCLCASLLMGFLGYHLIEKRRFPAWASFLSAFVVLGISIMYIYQRAYVKLIRPDAVSLLTIPLKNLKCEICEDFPKDIEMWKDLAEFNPEQYFGHYLLYRLGNSKNTPSFVMIGDSHAYAYRLALDEVAEKLDVAGYYVPSYIVPICGHTLSNDNMSFTESKVTEFLSWLEKHREIKHVVLIQRWSIRFRDGMPINWPVYRYDGSLVDDDAAFDETAAGLQEFCHRLKAIGKEVIIMTETPEVKNLNVSLIAKSMMLKQKIDAHEMSCTEEEYRKANEKRLLLFEEMEQSGMCRLVHIEQDLMPNGHFAVFQNNQLLMRDSNHLNAAGAKYAARQSLKSWKSALMPSCSMKTNRAD